MREQPYRFFRGIHVKVFHTLGEGFVRVVHHEHMDDVDPGTCFVHYYGTDEVDSLLKFWQEVRDSLEEDNG